MKKYLRLFFTTFKIGLFTFGGGYAMIPLLEAELVEKKKWLTHDEFMNIVVIAESTPGPIAVNSTTYVGYRLGGVLGAAMATLGVVLPSFIIIYCISLFFDTFMQLHLVAAAFKGIQACVIYLILSAGIKMFKKMPKKPLPLIMMGLTAVSMIVLSLSAVKFSAIFYIIIGAVVGLVSYLITLLRKTEKEETV